MAGEYAGWVSPLVELTANVWRRFALLLHDTELLDFDVPSRRCVTTDFALRTPLPFTRTTGVVSAPGPMLFALLERVAVAARTTPPPPPVPFPDDIPFPAIVRIDDKVGCKTRLPPIVPLPGALERVSLRRAPRSDAVAPGEVVSVGDTVLRVDFAATWLDDEEIVRLFCRVARVTDAPDLRFPGSRTREEEGALLRGFLLGRDTLLVE